MAEAPLERGIEGSRWTSALARLRPLALSWPVALTLILLLGAGLRFHGLDWDQPSGADVPLQMHPDERSLSFVADGIDWPDGIGGYFDTARSPLNPYSAPSTHSYVYGTFPLFLVKGVATIAGDDPAGAGNSYDMTAVWGRRVTALFDVATIAVVFALAAYLFGKRPGLVAALFYALAVLPTQLAHFFTMDPYVTFFGTLTLLLSALLVEAEGWRARGGLVLLAGLAIGLGLASKVTAWPLALGPVVATAIRIGRRDFPGLGLLWRTKSAWPAGHWTYDLSLLCVAALAAMLVFRVAQPYAFTGPHIWNMTFSARWWDDIRAELDRQNGDASFPPFVQFAGRTPFLAPLRNMVLFGLGPGLGIAAWASLAAAGVLLFKRRELSLLLPLTFALAVFGFQGPRFVSFMRYFLPMYPVLCVMAGWGIVSFWRWSRTWARGTGDVWIARRVRPGPRLVRWGAALAVAAAIGATVFWALAFQNVYNSENPRLQASRWIYDNAPAGSRITGERWDDTVPYPLPGAPLANYRLIEMEPYEPDSPEKVRQLVYGGISEQSRGGLDAASYVAITSNRVRDSVKKLERKYPATIRYYQLLESGELGFERVATFEVHPSFLGISIDDSGAEESFTVYDHPEVRLYRKTAAWDAERALALLNDAHPERAIDLLPRQGRTNGLQFTAGQARTQQSGGTFSEVFDAGGWASSAPALWWLVWLELPAFAALSWITWLFRSLPDRGYGLSKVLGAISVVLPTWLIVAWGGPHFSGGLAWAVFVAMVAGGAVLGHLRRDDIIRDVREHWRSWLTLEAVFLVAFFAFLALRYWNPDLWHHPQGGEKPMELAYLTAVARSTIMPPYDPWFAGGSMNYYYMGWFFAAVPVRALRLLPEVAFNLAVPTFAAFAAAVAASTAHNLVVLGGRARVIGGWMEGSWRPAVLAAFFGALLLVGIANLDGAHQLIEHLQAVNRWSFLEGVPVLGGAVGVAGGLFRAVVQGAALPPFDWWRSSRVHIGSFDITEFPYFSLLFADLHPHLMGLPFFGLTVAVSTSYVVSAAGGLHRQAWALSVALGLVLGLERTVHTWDLPTAVLIVVGAVAAGQALAQGRWDRRWWHAVAHLAIAGGVFVIAFAPYTRHFEVFNSGLVRAPETTKANQYFAHFGLFVALAAGFLALRCHEELRARGGKVGRNPILAMVAGPVELGAFAVFVAGMSVFTWRFGLTVVALSVLIEVFLLNLLWLEWRSAERDVARLLVTAVYALAFAVAAGVDVVTVRDDIERMNTVFKFSLQAWQLFALASAFAGWYVGRALWTVDGRRLAPRPGRGWAAWSWGFVTLLLLMGSSVYLYYGTKGRQDARFAGLSPTLDGLDYMRVATFAEDRGAPASSSPLLIRLGDDRPLIDWLRANVKGSPVIAEAVGPLYHWTGRISVNTGLPAVIGWDWHQVQQRFDYANLIERRRSDTKRFYADGDAKFAVGFLRTYNVSYVVVGTEEHAFGTVEGLAKFGAMPALTEVFRSGENVIYRVDESKLPALP